MPAASIRALRLHDLLDLPISELRLLLAQGQAIDPRALANMEYRGTALGLPRFVEKLTWKTFQKVFCFDETKGVLRGWNVRVQQRGIGADSVPKQKHGVPVTFGHYHVVPARPSESPWPYADGLLIDYGLGQNARFDPMGWVRDPLVSLHADDVELLLGWSYVDLGFVRIPTPSFFALERERPLSHRAEPPRAR
ncbi:MAG: hypothetical protein JNJ46_20340 [Myxococcales bacterium]|nr:hypothetical protein [Myxococcales bacterium]